MITAKGEEENIVIGFELGADNDITKLKRLEMYRKEFAANVSHELRTRLTSIQGFAETL